MNLSDITTKPWILALFKRDDGERFLLGDGYYDFKDSLQHFQPNSMSNDIVELQGADGQLLAGQVRRSGTQAFDGYIGDGTTNRKIVEQRRKAFLMFFRKKHYYTVVYIFCDGTAIKRERGYLVDAPSVPEIRQKSPEYHVALNFENVNYYEYAENAQGDEIYSNVREIVVSNIISGGLVWDALGAVSDAIQWGAYTTESGSFITLNDVIQNAPMSLTQIKGNAEQNALPSAYQAVEYVQSSGTQRIETDYYFTQGDYIEIKFAPMVMGDVAMFGVYGTGGGICELGLLNNEIRGNTAPAGQGYPYTTGTTYMAVNQNGQWSIGGTNFGSQRNTTATMKSFIFARNYENASGYKPSSMKFYSLLIKRGGATAYNFVPCYRKSDGVIGVYETINGKFFTNAGTGSFTKGNDTTVTPTPDAPVPVDVVTGEQTVGVCGKNLFDKDNTTVINAYVTAAGVIGASGPDRTLLISLHPNTTYTVSAERVGQVSGQPADDFAGTLISSSATPTIGSSGTRIFGGIGYYSSVNCTFTTDSTQNWLAFKISNINRSDYNGTLATVQLELGSTASDYQAFQSQTKTVNLGKNLFYVPTGTHTSGGLDWNVTSTTISASGTSSSGNSQSQYMTLDAPLPAGTYTFSIPQTLSYYATLQVIDTSGTDHTICTISAGNLSATATTTYDITKIRLRLGGWTSGDSVDISFPNEVQFEKGSTSTSWAEYFTPIELAKVGTYQDYIWNDNGTWKVHKDIGKVVLDGYTESSWSVLQTGTANFYYRLRYLSNSYIVNNTGWLSDSLSPHPISATTTSDGAFITTSGELRIRYGTELSLTDWKDQLKANPITLYYALATATDTAITQQSLIEQLEHIYQLYGGLNNISIVGAGNGSIEIRYATVLNPGGGFVWEDGGTGGLTTITIDAVDLTLPVWTITGPATNPTLSNITTGQTMSWIGTVPNGQTLIIDMNEQTATMAGANVYAFLSGNWVGLAPGTNRISYSVTGTDEASTLSWNNIVG